MSLSKRILRCAVLVLATLAPIAVLAENSARGIVDFDAQWKFLQQDVSGGEEAGLNDSGWRDVNVPHDWSIAGPIDEKNPSGAAGGFFPTGVAWYRKSFLLPAADAHRHVYVAFDGVMANSDVWINGVHLGHRPNGAVSFYYDLTGHLQFGAGARNVLAVRCDTSQQPASRWYEGGGIYRPVRLVVMQDVHLEPWSTFVTTPQVSASNATVRVESTVVNAGAAGAQPIEAALEITLTAPDGRAAGSVITPAQAIAQSGSAKFTAEIPVSSPQLWDVNPADDHAALYRVTVRVRAGKSVGKRAAVTDEERVTFGIREFHFDADTGFWLNGRNFKIKGAGVHMDGGAVGIAVPMAVWERRLLALRALGVNAIRTAHNPPSPEFLDLCDRLGFLVMDEMFDCWTVGKTAYDYHLYFDQWAAIDARDTVRRDRNHPSVILYSAGNEIHDTPHAELAHRILAMLVTVFHENDPTRPVTQALFRPNASHDYDNGLADMLDVIGQNYRPNEILAAHAAKPSRKILGTENTHERDQWLPVRDNAPYAGQFLWTGVDYLGEAGKWPMIENPSGLLDRTGFPHARGWERQSWWASPPNVHMVRRVAASERAAVDPGYEAVPPRLQEPLFHDWTPQQNGAHDETVEVYSNCEEVELLLNGHSLGRQKLHADASPLVWSVPYAPGSLTAIGYNHGERAAVDELHTAEKAARLVLTPERKTLGDDRNDVATVAVTAVDDAGVVAPTASDLVLFSVSGPAEIVAADNGSPTDHELFQLPQHHLFDGRAIVLLRATAGSGEIRLRGSAPGLSEGETTLSAIPGGGGSDVVRAF